MLSVAAWLGWYRNVRDGVTNPVPLGVPHLPHFDGHVAEPCLNRTFGQITVPDHGRFIIVGF